MQLKTTRAFRTISEAGEELDLQPHVLRFWESKFPQIKPMKRGGGRRFYRPEDIEFLRGIKVLLHDEKHPIKDVQKLIRVKGAGRVLELGRSVERAAKPKAVQDVELIPERIANFEPVPEQVLEPVKDTEILRPISDMPIAKAKSSEGKKISPVLHSVELEEDEVVVPPPLEPVAEIDLPEVDYVDDGSGFIETEVDIDDVMEGDVILDEVAPEESAPEPAAPEPAAVAYAAPSLDTKSLEDAIARLTKLRGQWSEFISAEAKG